MMDPINKAEAKKLFEENSVLMGNTDCVPVRTAKELLGAEVVSATMKLVNAGGKYYNIWDDDCSKYCKYLTEAGFFMAVTLHNVKLLGEPIGGSKKRISSSMSDKKPIEEPRYIEYWDAWSRKPSVISKDKKDRLVQSLKGYYTSRGLEQPTNDAPIIYLFLGFTSGIDFAFEALTDDTERSEK